METKNIDTTKLSPAVRQRKGDFVQGPDLEDGRIWHFGRIVDKEGGVIRCEDKDGSTFAIPSTHLYKSTKEEFEAERETENMEEITELEPQEIEKVAEQEETEQKPRKCRLVDPDMSRYVYRANIKTASGRASIDIDDQVAEALRGLNLEDVYDTVARYIRKINELAVDHKGLEELDTAEKLRARYEHLNPGMQRMNLGNRLRGAMARAEMVVLPNIPWTQE